MDEIINTETMSEENQDLQNATEQCSDEQSVEDVKSGILYEYNLKFAEKQAKKEKRKGIMQFVKYALCAVSAGVIQLVLFTVLQAVIPATDKTIHFIVEDMNVVTFVATTVALAASILWNFTFNRKFTFKDAGNVPKAMVLAFLFYVPFYPFQTWYVHTIKTLLVEHISDGFAGIIAEGTVMVINFALEFMWQKFVVFRKKKEKAVAGEENPVETQMDGERGKVSSSNEEE